MKMRQDLKVISNRRLLAKSGFLMLRDEERATAMVAFHILKNWFFYGIPNEEEICQTFRVCCAEQQKEILAALQYQHQKKERELAAKLAEESHFNRDNHPLKKTASL